MAQTTRPRVPEAPRAEASEAPGLALGPVGRSTRVPRVVCITQARVNSSRLPGKVLLLAAGRSLLAHHLARLQRARLLDAVVVATSDHPDDDALADHVAALGVAVFRGPEHDVLDRFVRCATAHRADVVVRVTGDCPLIDPDLVDLAVSGYLRNQPWIDFAGLDMAQFPRGFDTEVLSLALLRRIASETEDPADREHVTRFVTRLRDRFRIHDVGRGVHRGGLRLCVDEPADYELVRRLLETLMPVKPAFTWRDCVALLDRNPDWVALNRHVHQRQ